MEPRDWILTLFLAVRDVPEGLDETGAREGLRLIGGALPRDEARDLARDTGTSSSLRSDLEFLASEGLLRRRSVAGPAARFEASEAGVDHALELIDAAATSHPEAVQLLYDVKRDGLDAVAAATAEARWTLRRVVGHPYLAVRKGMIPWLRAVAGRLTFERGLDTATASVEAHHFHPERVRYRPSRWTLVRRVLNALEIQPDDVFVDFGSGKGRVLYQAAQHPFTRVVGVEISPELNRIAEDNLERNRSKLVCRNVELATADIAEYAVPDDMTIAYVYIPVTGELFQRTLEQILASLDRRPRPIKLVYIHPFNHPHSAEGEEAIRRTGRFEATPDSLERKHDDEDDRVIIYVNRPEAGRPGEGQAPEENLP
jgi:Histone methylation protein DOT1